MKQESPNLQDYLSSTSVVDWSGNQVGEKATQLTIGLSSQIEKIQTLFTWVRDNISHSKDVSSNVVTCTASEVYVSGTGICHAKSHLLAAMLRSQGIPTGFVYQVLIKDAPDTGTVLHGLNAVYITALSKWLRMDARGNTGGIDAQFSLHHEKLAFEMDESKGEFIYETIFVNPDDNVVDVLSKFSNREEMWGYLPESFERKL